MSQKTRDQTKSEIQSLAVQLSQSNKNLILEWSTGVGKSLASIKIIEEILKTRGNAKGYLICKESTHLKNWEEEFTKHRKKTVMNKVKMFLYASLHKYPHKTAYPDFIVLDECHALTEKRVALLKPIIGPKTKVILLSATIPKDKKDLIKNLIGSAYNYSIPLIEAIDLELLPQPSLVVHKMELKPIGSYPFAFKKPKKGYTISTTCEFRDMWAVNKNLRTGHGLVVNCNETQYYELITKQMAYYKNLAIIGSSGGIRVACRNKFLNLGSQRKKFLSKVKTNKAANIVKQFRGAKKRFICFTGAIEQSIRLGADSSVNSKNSKGINEHLVGCFNDGTCNELFAVKMLREGINLTNIEKGIIVQLDSTVGSFFQMFGRCLRHDYPEMHLIVVSNTQDEVYFENAMEDFDNKYVKYI